MLCALPPTLDHTDSRDMIFHALLNPSRARCASLQVTVAVETRKKAVMDAHLEQIVGQTERYSKMLATNLQAGAGEGRSAMRFQGSCRERWTEAGHRPAGGASVSHHRFLNWKGAYVAAWHGLEQSALRLCVCVAIM